jgi:hypothetical protein
METGDASPQTSSHSHGDEETEDRTTCGLRASASAGSAGVAGNCGEADFKPQLQSACSMAHLGDTCAVDGGVSIEPEPDHEPDAPGSIVDSTMGEDAAHDRGTQPSENTNHRPALRGRQSPVIVDMSDSAQPNQAASEPAHVIPQPSPLLTSERQSRRFPWRTAISAGQRRRAAGPADQHRRDWQAWPR